MTGVQVLFAFLLVVPFNAGFAHVGGYERTVYFITLLLASLSAAVCMIAPSAQHRFLFRHDDKQHLVFVSNRIVIVGAGVPRIGDVRLPAAGRDEAVRRPSRASSRWSL